MIAGAGAPTEVRGWGLPVIAEPASGVWDVGLRAGPWLLGRAAGRARSRRRCVVAGRPTLHRPVQRLLADRRVAVYALADPHGPELDRRRRDRPRGRVRAVVEPARAAGRRAGSTPTGPRPRRSTPRSTPRERRAVCAWPGRSSTPCPATRCSSSARPTRSATCRWRRRRAGTSRCSPTGASPASTVRCRPRSARPSRIRGPGLRAARRPDAAARHHGIRDRPGRTASGPDGGGAQRQRRRDLRAAGAGRAGARGGIRAGVRHAAHRRPGRTRGGDGPRTSAHRRPLGAPRGARTAGAASGWWRSVPTARHSAPATPRSAPPSPLPCRARSGKAARRGATDQAAESS